MGKDLTELSLIGQGICVTGRSDFHTACFFLTLV